MGLDFPYLVGLALIEEEKQKRCMPLGGRSIPKALSRSEEPSDKGNQIILELLIRVLQRTNSNTCIKRSLEEQSLLLLQIPMHNMQEKLPLIKAKWIKDGDSEKLIKNLEKCCENIWSVNFAKHSGVSYKLINIERF